MVPAFLATLAKMGLAQAAKSAAASAGQMAVRESAKAVATIALNKLIRNKRDSREIVGKLFGDEEKEKLSKGAKKAAPSADALSGSLFSAEENDPQFVEWMKQNGFSEKQIAETMAGRAQFRSNDAGRPLYSTHAASAAPSSAKASVAIPDWMSKSIVPDDADNEASFMQAMKDDGFDEKQIEERMIRFRAERGSSKAAATSTGSPPAPSPSQRPPEVWIEPLTPADYAQPPRRLRSSIYSPQSSSQPATSSSGGGGQKPPVFPPGQSPPPPPPGKKPPGPPGGNPPKTRVGLGIISKLAASFGSALKNLGGLTKGIGLATLAAVGLGAAVGTAIRRIERFSLAMSESNRHLAQYNSRMAASFAELDRNRLRRDIQSAQVTSASAKFANKGQDYLEDELRPFQNAAQNIGNMISGAVSHATAWGIDMAGKVTGIEWLLDQIEKKLGKDSAGNPVGNAINWLASQKNQPRKVGPQNQNQNQPPAKPLRMNRGGGQW